MRTDITFAQNRVATSGVDGLPVLFAGSEQAAVRTAEFFAAQIRNANTRRAYLRGMRDFARFCAERGLEDLAAVRPLHVAAWVEDLTARYSAPTAKQRLAAVRMLFDWLVTGQVVAVNPASSVRGPRYSIRRGKTPVLDAAGTRQLLDAIEDDTDIGRRDRALIGFMVYTFARIGAALAMRVEDYFYQGHRAWVRLHEKGGKVHEMPVHHALQDLLEVYIAGAGLQEGQVLFQSVAGRSGRLTGRAMGQSDAHAMLRRRARAAGLRTRVTNHTFRATGITEYLLAGGKLEVAQRMANHESSRTTGLYDRRSDVVDLSEIERIRI